LYFSQVSALEITLKYKLGKLDLPEPPGTYLRSRIERFTFTYLPLDDEDIYGMLDLPDTHRDPFDWLLLSNAPRRKLPLISKNIAFTAYPVELLW
jgi:PIN domain nuclease of toxin-antitoxin system